MVIYYYTAVDGRSESTVMYAAWFPLSLPTHSILSNRWLYIDRLWLQILLRLLTSILRACQFSLTFHL